LWACRPSRVDGSGIVWRRIVVRWVDGSGNVLACPSEERWVVTAFIVSNAAVDVASPTSGRTVIVTTLELLLKRRMQLH
jgi:hypothetical protein